METYDISEANISRICESCRKKSIGRFEVTVSCSSCGALNKWYVDNCRECGEEISLSEEQEKRIRDELGIMDREELTEKLVRTLLDKLPYEKKEDVADYLCVFCQGLAEPRTEPLTY